MIKILGEYMHTMLMRRKGKNVKQAKYNLRLDKDLLEHFSAKAKENSKSVNLYLNEIITRELERK